MSQFWEDQNIEWVCDIIPLIFEWVRRIIPLICEWVRGIIPSQLRMSLRLPLLYFEWVHGSIPSVFSMGSCQHWVLNRFEAGSILYFEWVRRCTPSGFWMGSCTIEFKMGLRETLFTILNVFVAVLVLDIEWVSGSIPSDIWMSSSHHPFWIWDEIVAALSFEWFVAASLGHFELDYYFVCAKVMIIFVNTFNEMQIMLLFGDENLSVNVTLKKGEENSMIYRDT